MAGLIKTVLMLKHRQIVPNLHFETPNPRIHWDGFHAVVPVANMPWSAPEHGSRRAAVSSFGLSGTNGHVILEEYPTELSTLETVVSPSTRVFTYSARSEQALHRLVEQQKEFVASDRATLNLSHYSYTVNAGRTALEHRCWIMAQTADELVEVLSHYLAQKLDPRWAYHVADRKESRKLLSSNTFDPSEASKWYLSGASIDWNMYVEPSDRHIIDVPKYPFADDRFWLTENDFKSQISKKAEHKPIQRIESPSTTMETDRNASAVVAPSMSAIVRMQLHQASSALNTVTASQLSVLTTRYSVPKTQQAGEVMNTDRWFNSIPEIKSAAGAFGLIDRCGEWSLITAPLLAGETEADAKARLIDALEKNPDRDFGHPSADGAVPIVGRAIALTCKDTSDAIAALSDEKGKRIFSADVNREPSALIFMFPGVGDHYINMGLGLYESDADFRSDVEYCCAKVGAIIGSPLLEVLYPAQKDDELPPSAAAKPAFDFKAMLGREAKVNPDQERMNATRHSQTLVFIMEYAMARYWQRRGYQPDAMIGYSIGEYVAAVLAGIMSIDDALELVGRRAMLIEKLPGGSLLAVPLDEHAIKPYLSGSGLSVAINSTPSLTVIGGDHAAIDALASTLSSQDIVCRKLQSTDRKSVV
jgi:acyl transferase domain-containing protein